MMLNATIAGTKVQQIFVSGAETAVSAAATVVSPAVMAVSAATPHRFTKGTPGLKVP